VRFIARDPCGKMPWSRATPRRQTEPQMVAKWP
jgi:hypothetical protein